MTHFQFSDACGAYIIAPNRKYSSGIFKLLQQEILTLTSILILQTIWWSRGSMLAFSTQVRGFKPGRSRRSHVVDLGHVRVP